VAGFVNTVTNLRVPKMGNVLTTRAFVGLSVNLRLYSQKFPD